MSVPRWPYLLIVLVVVGCLNAWATSGPPPAAFAASGGNKLANARALSEIFAFVAAALYFLFGS